jgi:DNA-binding MarR family transcriptional regulator
MTRWLSAQEQHAWRAYLDASRLLFARLEQELQRDSGMPMSYYDVLVHLSEAPGRTLRMSELADGVQSSRSRLSHAVARLEARGWIERLPCPDDRRGQLARMTDAGYAALAAAAPAHVEAVRALLIDRLPAEDFAQLGRISAALRGALSD